MRRAKVAIVHPKLSFGGSEGRALWAIETLKQDYDVSLITGGRVDLRRLNGFYGTSLESGDFTILYAPHPLGLRYTSKFAALRGHLIQRYIQRVAPSFDLLISAYNLYDFGVRGIQFLADFGFIDEWRLTLHPALGNWETWWYGDSPLRRAYLGLCRLISPSNPEAWKRNLTLANSDWGAALLRREFGIEARTVYPPVSEEFSLIPWEERENGFVCIGRVVPEKRMDAIIELLGRVREDGCDIHLHLLGGIDDSQYGRRLKQLCAKHHDWVFPEGLVFGRRKKELMARHRFGINACENESFGIAVAEMVKAGCIVFVPDSGGQVEIVNHPALIYEDDADAVRKIEAVLTNAALQGSLREHLSQGAQRFSVSNFQGAMRNLVREFLEGERRVVPALKVG
jgi:glycosyltransferase involved in cell wall biosynthesis